MDLISREAAIAAIEAEKKTIKTDDAVGKAIYLGMSRAVLEVSALPSLAVSVKDRLPEPGQKVLVYLNMSGGGVWDTGYHMGGGEWTFTAWEAPNDAATHWMPLPDKPVE